MNNAQLDCIHEETEEFSTHDLPWIAENNLWNLWIPASHGGMECSLSKGLDILQQLARLNGSLGWTVTLCSGANFFFGNLQPHIADEIFLNAKKPVCFGGSGGLFGTAEKIGGKYRISGTWKYATGAPYLTHFTLNAKLTENGRELLTEDGTNQFRSFVLPASAVNLIDDWHTMGLKATATQSFSVDNYNIHEDYSFVYNKQFHGHALFSIDFEVFADLTLWVNYIGMAEHYLEEAEKQNADSDELTRAKEAIRSGEKERRNYTRLTEQLIAQQIADYSSMKNELHKAAKESVQRLSASLIELHTQLGIKAASESHPLNRIFRDYFTATQHHIFR